MDPSQTWIWTNVAHAQLLSGDLPGARFTYKAYQDGRIGDEDTPWTDVIAADFAVMKAAGLAHSAMNEILEGLREGA